MSDLWVVGGEQRETFREFKEWHGYRAAVVARVTGDRVQRVFAYHTPAAHRPSGEGSHCFKAATFTGELAYLCTDTEVLICGLPDFAIRRVISLPCFNDLHHVVPGPEGSLYVTVTGLDAVAEVTAEGELVRLLSTVGGSPWQRFSQTVDYRRVRSTKPHLAHPNFVFFRGDRPWVTRFEQRDAVALDNQSERLPIGGAGPHDGQVCGERVFFTTTDGLLVDFDLATGDRRALDLNRLSSRPGQPLGWSRGLWVENGRAWVGHTRVRYTALRRNLSWLRHGFHADVHQQPTRVALYDTRQPALVRELDLDGVRLDAVFSIHPAPASGNDGRPS